MIEILSYVKRRKKKKKQETKGSNNVHLYDPDPVERGDPNLAPLLYLFKVNKQ